MKTFFPARLMAILIVGLLVFLSSCAAQKCDCPSFGKNKRHGF